MTGEKKDCRMGVKKILSGVRSDLKGKSYLPYPIRIPTEGNGREVVVENDRSSDGEILSGVYRYYHSHHGERVSRYRQI